MRFKKLFFALALVLAGTLTASAALMTSNGVKPTYGDGSKNSPYEIRNAENLRWFVYHENRCFWYPNDYAILIFDIDLKDVCGPTLGSWIPLGYAETIGGTGYFEGCIDGNGRTIKNLYINGKDFGKDEPIGFMGEIHGARIYNLTIEGQIDNPNKYTGGFAGSNTDYPATLSACVSKVKFTGIVSSETTLGGILGESRCYRANFDGSVYDGDMTMLYGDFSNVGGIIGKMLFSIRQCTSTILCFQYTLRSSDDRKLRDLEHNCDVPGFHTLLHY